MLRPFVNISIGSEAFDFVTTGEFSSSWKLLTDTGEITVPNKFRRDNRVIFVGENNVFNKGDLVNISAGYFPTLEPIFEGYVSKIEPEIPVKIYFEDAAFLFKQTNITLSFENVTLTELLESSIQAVIEKSSGYLQEGLRRIEVRAIDANLGAFRITNVNLTVLLQELKKTYALTSFFRGHILYVGLAYYAEGTNRGTFTFQENIIDSGTDLEYRRLEDISFKIKAISIFENNQRLEIEVGDPEGEQRTITKYNLPERELREAAEREIDRLKFEGFRGKITTFMQPVIRHGDEVEIIDPLTPERNGIYLAESVNYSIGVDGYFQEIFLGAKVTV